MARSRLIAQRSFTGRLSLLLTGFFLTLLLLGGSIWLTVRRDRKRVLQ